MVVIEDIILDFLHKSLPFLDEVEKGKIKKNKESPAKSGDFTVNDKKSWSRDNQKRKYKIFGR